MMLMMVMIMSPIFIAVQYGGLATMLLRIPLPSVQHQSLKAPDYNLLKPTGYVMHQQFNIQQLYVLPTPYLWVLYLSENKQRLVPLTA